MRFHQLKHFARVEKRHAASVQLCPSPLLGRRRFMLGSAAALAMGCLPAEANVPVPYDWNAAPPMDNKLSFIEWMVRSRGEEAGFLGQRWDRFRQAVASRDLWDQRDMRALLLTPREHFVTNPNLSRAYGPHPRHRLRSDNQRSAHRRAHDQCAECCARRQGVRGRNRFRIPIGLSRESYRQGVVDRDHQAAGGAHPPALRFPDRARLRRVQVDHDQARRRLLRLGAGGSLRQGHRHLRHRPYPAAAFAADEAERHDGDSGRPTRRAPIRMSVMVRTYVPCRCGDCLQPSPALRSPG
jgi:hypothetical protein